MPKQELDQNLQAACVRMYRVCMYIHGTHASEHRWVIGIPNWSMYSVLRRRRFQWRSAYILRRTEYCSVHSTE